MKATLEKVSVTVFAGLMLVLVACQRESLDVAQARYRQQGTQSLKRLTARYSRSFILQASQNPSHLYASYYEGGDYFGSSWGQNPWGGQIFHPRVDLAARRCVEMVQMIPPIRATYGRAMVTVARCLNRIIEERNFLLTWGYQQGDYGMQHMWGYSHAWPLWAPYQQFGQQHYSQFQPWLNQGWLSDSGE